MPSPEELKAKLKGLMADPENMISLDCKDNAVALSEISKS
jgi:hypothetical protein